MLVEKRVRATLLILLAFVFPHGAHSDEQLRYKIAQMIIVGFNGTTVPDSLQSDLTGRNLGGVILLGRNCISPAQIQARGIMTTLKHFPGHGSAGADSHLELPDITSTWADSELIPYRSLLSAKKVDVVMIGHLYNAHMDSLYPS